MLGSHPIKTWSATQQAYALSSAEAELYAMIEGVTRAKGLRSLAYEMGFRDLVNVVRLGTDSSAARSFVCFSEKASESEAYVNAYVSFHDRSSEHSAEHGCVFTVHLYY